MTTFAVAAEVHPAVLVAVKLYTPATKFAKVVLVLVPIKLPGLIVQLPNGKPLRTTIPVAIVQVG